MNAINVFNILLSIPILYSVHSFLSFQKAHRFYIPRGLFNSELLHKFNEAIATDYNSAKFNGTCELFLKRKKDMYGVKNGYWKNNIKYIKNNENVDDKQLKQELSECDKSINSIPSDDDESSISSTQSFSSSSSGSYFDAGFRS